MIDQELVRLLLIFTVIVLAADRIGKFFVTIRLPLISGFLFTGILAGPYVLGMMPKVAIQKLRFIDEASLAVIAFAAGSELFLKELRSQLKSIACVTSGLVLSTFTLGSITVYLLGDYVPFMREMDSTSRVAVAILAGAILVARSPSSAIAIVNELRAKGTFTRTMLGVTVIMDVVVIMVFAINSAIADALFTNVGFNFNFLALVFAEILVSLGVGWLLAKAITFLCSLPFNLTAKAFVLLGLGYGVFELAGFVKHYTEHHGPFEFALEPLLICMIASFYVTNWTRYRNDLSDILHRLGPPVYVAFFTLTGASLALNILVSVWPIALALVVVRLVGIFIGSFTGGVISKQPMAHNRISWMAYVTQAGVGLGLAKEVVVAFPEIGVGFSTMIIAVIVINQLIGPPGLKFAIQHVGESHLKGQHLEGNGEDTPRDVVIFGLNPRSLALAKQLAMHNWNITIATREEPESEVAHESIKMVQLPDWSATSLKTLKLHYAESVVSVLKDEDSLSIFEIVYESYGVETMVVLLRDRENRAKFKELGALIVEPETSVVTLLEQLVRAPSGTSLLLGMEDNQEIADIELRNRALHNIALRDLRLPLDVLILSIHRGRQTLVSKGYTRLRVGDRITMVGPEEHLEEVMLRFEE